MRKPLFPILLTAVLASLAALPLGAHCDALDGPVVIAAKQALAKGDVNPILAWVKAEDEAQIRAAFARTLKVGALGPEAQELAEAYFFETLVRIHRAGEGAPYTGLKPAGMDFGPAIPAADKALASGDLKPVFELMHGVLKPGLEARFKQARAARSQAPSDPAAGRKAVAAYVDFLHYVDGVYRAAAGGGAHAEGAEAEAPAKPEPHHQH
ncbi:DUF6448 family protein [Geothrix edaphica]|uniref:Peptidoglycan-binding protein n=1 Tax=Geothrix edaphica TaxID=2927976 RepID=A0ABQ5Q203_9BACT|nr:DUF6448 family protein [Geothrix edaphica]GLH68375.1 hypothetical protein GETHED_27390 [Geothrix edaphica]